MEQHRLLHKTKHTYARGSDRVAVGDRSKSVAIVNPAGTVSPESKRKRDVLGLLIRCAVESIPTRPLAAGGRGLTQTQDTLSTHES